MRSVFLIIFLCTTLLAKCPLPWEVYVGPEIYSLNRFRASGTEQHGRMDGGRVGFDRIKGYCWYYGADYLYASGKMRGETATGSVLVSNLIDSIAEGRFGYCLQQPARCAFFVPFAGYGYFRETNAFHKPSAMPFTYTDSFRYFVAGFLSGINLTPLLSMGLNFKMKFMIDGTSRVTDDPDYDEITLKINNKVQYRLDIPFSCCLPKSCCHLDASFVPFYEFRHFGGCVGFPFDFIGTKYHIGGARFSIGYCF